MRGVVGLHGGAEFTAGDEPFLTALLGSLERSPVRVVIVPTAGAGGRPEAVVDVGRRALQRVAQEAGIDVEVTAAHILDEAAANDPEMARAVADAHLVYLPGGDPALIPRVFRDSLVWRSLRDAHQRGTAIAGASAGAMALGPRTWTPRAWLDGLGLVPGLVVVPHFDTIDTSRYASTRDQLAAAGIGYLGLDERTGVLREPDDSGLWRVAGPGRVHWGAPDGPVVIASSGESIRLPS